MPYILSLVEFTTATVQMVRNLYCSNTGVTWAAFGTRSSPCCSTHSCQELARQVAYLKEENRILRARLPERLVATPQENRRLLRFGRKLGQQLKELISIVSDQSFLRWVREAACGGGV